MGLVRRSRFFILGVCLLCGGSAALEISETVGPVDISVYAPDWTWQKRDINILFVLRNTSDEAVTVSLSLYPPVGLADHFSYGEAEESAGGGSPYPSAEVVVPPGETVRAAFTGITALDGVPRQTYDFSLGLRAGADERSVPYAVKTIRGAAVNPGQWALYLPIILALVWSVAFVWVLCKMGGAWSWLVVSEPIKVDDGDAP